MLEGVWKRPKIEARREEVRSLARELGVSITKVPGGYHLEGKAVDLWVRELEFVLNYELGIRLNRLARAGVFTPE